MQVDIQRGSADIGNTGGTDAPGTNFGSMASTVVFNATNRRTNAGWGGSNGNMEIDDLSGGVHLSAVGTIDLDREAGAAATNARFYWESWEYTGPGGGVDEFIVRGRYQLTLTGESVTQAVSGITNIDDCIPFITGILADQTNDDADHATAFTWMSSGTLNVKRGAGANGTVQVYVTVVEFTGSNWQVVHGLAENNGDVGTITLRDAADGTTVGGGDISNWDNATIFHQYKANNLNGVDDSISDTSAVYTPGAGTTTVSWVFDVNHVDSVASGVNSGAHMVHVLKNNGMIVTRFSSAASSEGIMAVDISSANADSLSTTSVEVSRSSSGTGTAYGRGWVGWELTSITNLNLWAHRSGNTVNTRIQIIDLNPPPVAITDMEDEQIDSGELNNVITGYGFEATQGTGIVELGSAEDYTGTKVTQIIDTWADTSIQFDSVQGSLADGIVWLFVTNDTGDRSIGYKVNIGVPSYSFVVESLLPDHYWAFQNDYVDTINASNFNSVQSGTPDFVTVPKLARGDTHSFRLNGVEHTEAPNSNYMNVGSPQTRRWMGGWIQLDSIQQELRVIYEEGAQINNIAYLIGFGNILLAQVADTGDDYVQAFSDFPLAPNRTYHIFFKFEASGFDAEFRLYIDGVLQTRTSGNPWTATDLDNHSGDIALGMSGNNLEVGGTDIAFSTAISIFYAHWATWSALSLTPTTDIRIELFEKGVAHDVLIATDTEANMQIALDVYADTLRDDAPLCIKVDKVTGGGDFELRADNITFHERASIQVQFIGGDTLTWVNENGSATDAAKLSTPYGGTITVVEAVPVKVTVSDINTGVVIQNARVRITADAGGDLVVDTVILEGITDALGVLTGNLDYTSDQPILGRIRKTSPYYKTTNIIGTVSTAGFDGTVLMIPDG